MFRFSLRSLFVLITLTAVAVAVYVRQARIHRVVSRLVATGGTVQYHPGVIPGLTLLTGGFFLDAQAIDLSRSQVTHQDLQDIGNLSRLECLYLANTRINHRSSESIGQVASLRRLALWQCHGISDGCIDDLLQLKNLEVLDIHETRISSKALPRLLELSALKHLLFTAPFDSDEKSWLDEQDVEALARVKATVVGDCYARHLTDRGLALLRSFDTSRMTRLVLRDLPGDRRRTSAIAGDEALGTRPAAMFDRR